MKPKTQRRTGRWSDRAAQIEVVSPYADRRPTTRTPRSTDNVAGPRAYELSYDISLGYGQDRPILLP
ncbi:MAG: hypothetical protein ACREK1_07770 [Longimicrobiales bacterium]